MVSFPVCETLIAIERKVSLRPELGEHLTENAGGYSDPSPHRTNIEITSRPFGGISRCCHEIATEVSEPLYELAVEFAH
jgi:hypothetical protein